MNTRIFFWVLGFFLPLSTQAQNFSIPITVSNGATSQVLTVGVNTSASNNADVGIDVIAPPAPPSGFYASMGASGNEYYTDIRSAIIEEKIYKVNFRFNEDAQGFPAGNITLTWNNSLFQTHTASATFTVGTTTTDLRTSNTVTLSAGTFGSFTFGQLKFTPQATALPEIGLNPSSLTFAAQVGVNPATQTFSITNTGSGTLSWTATDDASWLTLSQTSGTNGGTVTASINTSGLVAGTYSGTITIGATGVSNKTVSVLLTVSAPSNQPPVVANTITNQTLTAGGQTFSRNLTASPVVFTDANNDVLTFTATSSNTSIATTTVSGTTLTVTPIAAGTSTITITANDGKGGTVSMGFDISVLSSNSDVIYARNGLQSISNAVLFNNKITFIAALDPTANTVAGYPDATEWTKLHLVNESGLLKEIEPQSTASSADHTDLKITPDGGKLALIYQAPTGDNYGFRMPYTIWDGSSISQSEVFSNSNYGAWPRIEFLSNGVPIIHSFAHAGYFVASFRKASDSSWEGFRITDYSNYIGYLQVIRESDEKIHLFGSRNLPVKGLAHLVVNGSEASVTATSNDIISGNNIEFGGAAHSKTGELYVVYSDGAAIKIAKHSNGVWSFSQITTLEGVGRRASIMLTDNDIPIVALQNSTQLKVLLF